jgi:hypothetical protein
MPAILLMISLLVSLNLQLTLYSLGLSKNTLFFSNFSPIYGSFLKNTVLGAKYRAFSHEKSRRWQLTGSHLSKRKAFSTQKII